MQLKLIVLKSQPILMSCHESNADLLIFALQSMLDFAQNDK